MSNPQPQRQLLSFARNCWPLVPVITAFGMISGILGLAFDFFPTPWLDAQSLYIPLGSLCLGLSLGAALWLCGVVRTWTALATIAGATIAGHVLELCVVLYLHSRNIPAPMVDLASGPIALVLYAVVLLLTRPNTRRGRSLLVAAGCAGLVAVAVGACNEIAAGTLNFLLLGFPLSPMWQTAMAFFLGVAVVANQAWDSASVATEGFEQTRMPLPKRLAPVAALAICFAVLIGLRNFAYEKFQRNARLQEERQAALDREPSIPPPELRSPLLAEISGWKVIVFRSLTEPREIPGDSPTLFPKQSTYYARYKEVAGTREIEVNITEYPSPLTAESIAKARKESVAEQFAPVSNEPGMSVMDGNQVYETGAGIFWTSEDKLILLKIPMTDRVFVGDFIQGYVTKYPSSRRIY